MSQMSAVVHAFHSDVLVFPKYFVELEKRFPHFLNFFQIVFLFAETELWLRLILILYDVKLE